MRTWVGRTHPRDEQGAVAILTALVMVVLMLFVAIVVDLGMARDVRRQSQNAGDAAALAGAATSRTRWQTVRPSISGMIISSTTRSGFSA